VLQLEVAHTWSKASCSGLALMCARTTHVGCMCDEDGRIRSLQRRCRYRYGAVDLERAKGMHWAPETDVAPLGMIRRARR
jgi:hypothetical protein